jgi:predicted P-loop ATPase
MSDEELIERLLQITPTRRVTQDAAPAIRPHPKDRRHFIIIGTSGSHDYLEDPHKDKRFWPDLKLTSSERKRRSVLRRDSRRKRESK